MSAFSLPVRRVSTPFHTLLQKSPSFGLNPKFLSMRHGAVFVAMIRDKSHISVSSQQFCIRKPDQRLCSRGCSKFTRCIFLFLPRPITPTKLHMCQSAFHHRDQDTRQEPPRRRRLLWLSFRGRCSVGQLHCSGSEARQNTMAEGRGGGELVSPRGQKQREQGKGRMHASRAHPWSPLVAPSGP